jgi:hypothetical protein
MVAVRRSVISSPDGREWVLTPESFEPASRSVRLLILLFPIAGDYSGWRYSAQAVALLRHLSGFGSIMVRPLVQYLR